MHSVQRHAHLLPHHRHPDPSPEGSRSAGIYQYFILIFVIGIGTFERTMEKVAMDIHEISNEMAKTKEALATLTILLDAIKSGKRKVLVHSSMACSTTITTAQNISKALNKQEHRSINLQVVSDLVKALNSTAIEDCALNETISLKEVTSKAIENTKSVILAQENDLVKLASVIAIVTGSTGRKGLSFIEENAPLAQFEIGDTENNITNETSTRANPIIRKTGSFKSPNYPNKYPNNLNRNYPISAPVGHTIKFTFIHFNIQVNCILTSVTYVLL